MAAMNSSALACKYATASGIGSSELSSKAPSAVAVSQKMSVVCRASQHQQASKDQVSVGTRDQSQGRRAALMSLGAALFAVAASNSSANAGIIDEYLEKSKANKELNDKKRLATSGANFARAYTVQFGSCSFPYNFTGCQDLAKQKKVPFLSDDLELECQGRDAYKCGSNVFWKGGK